MYIFNSKNKVLIIKEEWGRGFVYTFDNNNKIFIVKVRVIGFVYTINNFSGQSRQDELVYQLFSTVHNVYNSTPSNGYTVKQT